MARVSACVLAVCISLQGMSQVDTLFGETDVVISASKWEQKISEVPNKVIRVSKKDILWNQPQTAADMLQQSGTVFVQKSQLAGGSPIIRGFATNRVLLVVDGVRMNNAIYRSGNLQNVISIDPLYLQNGEVIFGPGSMVYGSDAIGGVMDFNSIQPRLSEGQNQKKHMISSSALTRFSMANGEQTYHADLNLGKKKWAYFGSVTYSTFQDQKMGRHGGQDNYLRPEFVQRINNKDSIIKNPDSKKQVFTGYEQWNVLQKIRYRPTKNWDMQYAFYYGGTESAPRYDRLIEYRNNLLRFAEWNYGPMLWRMHTFSVNYAKKNLLSDEIKMVAAYQNYEESRIDRQLNSSQRRTQRENVEALTLNVDARKKLGDHELFYGAEIVSNAVNSAAWSDNIDNGNRINVVTRYPDGSSWNSLGFYALYKRNIKEKITMQSGLRYNYAAVKASFDKSIIAFPYSNADITDGALTGSFGLAYRPDKRWQLNVMANTGFRVPNIDDIGKLFESAPGVVVVPNPNLESEYAWNFETGVVRKKSRKYRFELVGFYTRLSNAIVRRNFKFNGQDSLPFDGTISRVEALENIGIATVWGLQAMGEVWILSSLRLYGNANWTYGKETDETIDEQVPLRSSPPFFGNAGFKWQRSKFQLEFFGIYNSEISYENLAPVERQKIFIYAKDSQGRPYAPAWYTLNLRAGYHWQHVSLNTALENFTNQRYRSYSSGIVAPGTNLVISIRLQL